MAAERGKVYIGTSGFTYKSWNAHFYPPELPARLQLEFYATQFPTVEINTTFYRLPGESMVKGWAKRVPKTFVYALKGSRFITHMKKLANLDEPVKRPRFGRAKIPKGNGLDIYFERIKGVKARAGVILWQLPPMLQIDLPRLDDFLQQLKKYRYRHAVEFRHASWYEDKTFDLLRKHNVAHVALSTLNMPQVRIATADIVYVRFHGLEGGFAHDYTRAELEPWAKFCREESEAGRTVFAYFNNDVNVRAPQNAKMLIQMVGDASVDPEEREITIPPARARKTILMREARKPRRRRATAGPE
ncbi:MAG TPA: DUF72 domain-containing protein [Pyrinomonadaceae bacterium]